MFNLMTCKITKFNSSFNSKFRKDDEVVSATSSQPTLLSPAQQQRLEGGLHTPYFHTERPRSRSRSANPTSGTREDLPQEIQLVQGNLIWLVVTLIRVLMKKNLLNMNYQLI